MCNLPSNMKSSSHKTWQTSLLFLKPLQIQNLKRKSGGTWHIISPHLKKWGDTSPVSPTKLRPWWGLRETVSCICGEENQTAHHIIYHCEALRSPNSLDDLVPPGPEGVCWLDRLVGIAWGSLLIRKKLSRGGTVSLKQRGPRRLPHYPSLYPSLSLQSVLLAKCMRLLNLNL